MLMGLSLLFLMSSAAIMMINDWVNAKFPNRRKPCRFGEGMFRNIDTENWFSPIV